MVVVVTWDILTLLIISYVLSLTFIFENSCPGNHCFSKTRESKATASFTSEDSRPRPSKGKSGGAGGYTCCAPGCYNNSNRQKVCLFTYFQLARAKKKDC